MYCYNRWGKMFTFVYNCYWRVQCLLFCHLMKIYKWGQVKEKEFICQGVFIIFQVWTLCMIYSGNIHFLNSNPEMVSNASISVYAVPLWVPGSVVQNLNWNSLVDIIYFLSVFSMFKIYDILETNANHIFKFSIGLYSFCFYNVHLILVNKHSTKLIVSFPPSFFFVSRFAVSWI